MTDSLPTDATSVLPWNGNATALAEDKSRSFALRYSQFSGSEGIHQAQVLERESEHRVAELAGSRDRTDRRPSGRRCISVPNDAAAAPGPAGPPGLVKNSRLALRRILQIHRRQVAGDAEAATGRRRIDDAVDQIQTPVTRENVGEVGGRHAIFAVHQTEAAQLSIARRHINDPRLLVDDGRGILRAGTPIVGRPSDRGHRVRERPLPADGARLRVDCVDGIVAADNEHASRRSLRHITVATKGAVKVARTTSLDGVGIWVFHFRVS